MTGETGAGKSIVVDAVNLVLGGRAARELIRTGTDKAWVEAVFDASGNEEVAKWAQAQALDDFDGTVTLYREITRSGRNLCRVCGVVMPLSALKDIAVLLMDVHGQHEAQFLINWQYHLLLWMLRAATIIRRCSAAWTRRIRRSSPTIGSTRAWSI